MFTEHLGARRLFENRDEALPNFLSCFCVKSGKKHPPVTIVGDYRDRILMGQITQTSDKTALLIQELSKIFTIHKKMKNK